MSGGGDKNELRICVDRRGMERETPIKVDVNVD